MLLLVLASACQQKAVPLPVPPKVDGTNEAACLAVMQKHLDAIAQRNLTTLKSTLSLNGEMQLILPQTETTTTVDEFMLFHQEWFKDTLWTLENKILNSKIGADLGMVVVASVYREPERDGKPYFNRMVVSYDVEKIDSTWYVIKDHMSSIQKSTDLP